MEILSILYSCKETLIKVKRCKDDSDKTCYKITNDIGTLTLETIQQKKIEVNDCTYTKDGKCNCPELIKEKCYFVKKINWNPKTEREVLFVLWCLADFEDKIEFNISSIFENYQNFSIIFSIFNSSMYFPLMDVEEDSCKRLTVKSKYSENYICIDF